MRPTKQMRKYSKLCFPGARCYNVLNNTRSAKDMNSIESVQQHRPEILRIAAEHGAHNLRIFGSVARGEADDESDIDFLVEVEPGRSLLDLGGLQVELQELLARRVDIVTERGLKARVRERVLKEALPL